VTAFDSALDQPRTDPRPLRADARRNRERILAAAREVFVEQGLAAPLDAIAQRAGVGIGTLYRRFPDRESLVRELALDAFVAVRGAADAAVGATGTGSTVMKRFFQRIAELRLGVLMATLFPVVETQVRTDAKVAEAAGKLALAMDRVVEVARDAGELRADVTADDVIGLLAMLTRPLPGMPPAFAEQLTPRLLHLIAEGLESPVATPAPPVPDRPAEWPPLPRDGTPP
jgi:AcrR family transcriptional regulator